MYILILLFIYYGAYANVYCDIEKERERDGWYKLYIRVTTYTKHYNFLLPSKNMEQQSKQLWNVDIIPFDEILHIQQQLDMICIERLIYCNHNNNNNNNTKEFIDLKVKSLNIVSKSNIEVVPLALSGFRGCLRNVPVTNRNCKIFENVNLNEKKDIDNNEILISLARTHVIVVGKKFQ